jgi:hypothetical protein
VRVLGGKGRISYIRQGVACNTRDGGFWVRDYFAVLHVEALYFLQVGPRTDELGYDCHFFACIDLL